MAGTLLVDELEQMTTLLGTLARCVALDRKPSDADLRVLLQEAQLDADPALIAELDHWTTLLSRTRERTSEASATVDALTLRGLPEASAVLAVATVTAAVARSRDASPLTGGLGFAAGGAGGAFDSWSDRPGGWSQADVGPKIVVAPDGTGTHRNLVDALEAAPPGATILLKQGVHYLKHGRLLHQPVTLVGEGMESTELVAHQGQFVLAYQRTGLIQLRDLTIRWAGPLAVAANVVVMSHGEVDFERCRFCGAAASGSDVGAGVLLTGAVVGSVRSCRMEANGSGIAIQGEATPLLEDNLCRENSGHGIRYTGRASGTARANTCVANAFDGIAIEEAASPLLESNICQANGWSGIGCVGRSDATVRHNACQDNHHSGIHVREQAQPVLEGNSCAENRDSGISFGGSSGGAAIDNRCTRNQKYGVCVAQRGGPFLATNELCDNRDSGIAYFQRGAGTARGNMSSGNAHHGIYVGDQARPMLEGNLCERNRWSGLAYFGSAGGTAMRNRCRRNGKREIFVDRGAAPVFNNSGADGGASPDREPIPAAPRRSLSSLLRRA
jgi:parallel beta-helix repeat protein